MCDYSVVTYISPCPNVLHVPYSGWNWRNKILVNAQKGCFGEYNFGDSIHAIDHTHCLPTCGCNGQQVLSRSDGLRLPCLLQHMASFLKRDSSGSEESSASFFGKVLHSLFASHGHMCIITEDPTFVIITHSLRGKNFGALKFGDQASICQIRQNLLPPIFSTIRY